MVVAYCSNNELIDHRDAGSAVFFRTDALNRHGRKNGAGNTARFHLLSFSKAVERRRHRISFTTTSCRLVADSVAIGSDKHCNFESQVSSMTESELRIELKPQPA